MDVGRVVFGLIELALGLAGLYLVVFRRDILAQWLKPKTRPRGSTTVVRESWGPVKKYAVLFGCAILIWGAFIAWVLLTK